MCKYILTNTYEIRVNLHVLKKEDRKESLLTLLELENVFYCKDVKKRRL